MRLLRPTPLTLTAVTAILVGITFSAAFLLARYPVLPDILPVHFGRSGRPNGWQWKTYSRVLMPVIVQATLALVSGAIGTLLLSRSHALDDEDSDDIRAARSAAEAIALFTAIWVAFQAYAAVALVMMWQRGQEGLGPVYGYVMLAGIVASIAVGVRAHIRLGRPGPRAFVAEHWRLGQLYHNPSDPALFVPTRDGSRWTLNFGRPVAAALIALTLTVGIVAPAVILRLLLR